MAPSPAEHFSRGQSLSAYFVPSDVSTVNAQETPDEFFSALRASRAATTLISTAQGEAVWVYYSPVPPRHGTRLIEAEQPKFMGGIAFVVEVVQSEAAQPVDDGFETVGRYGTEASREALRRQFFLEPAYGAGDDDVEVESPTASYDVFSEEEYELIISRRRELSKE